MFHFQLVVLRLDVNYTELRPQLAVSFGEMQTQLPLPELASGSNLLGVGKNLTVEISDMEIADWFAQYALCLEFTGSLLRKPLKAFLSLEKLEINDEITEQIITMDNEGVPEVDVRMSISLKFKYVRNMVSLLQPSKPEIAMMRTSSNMRREEPVQASAFSKTTKTSFLYGALAPPSKPAITKKKPQRPASSKINSGQPMKAQRSKDDQQPRIATQQPYIPTYVCQQNITQEFEENEFMGQKYFCPPVMEFTNQPKPEPLPKQVVQDMNRGMENYSFQVNEPASVGVPPVIPKAKPKKPPVQAGKSFSKEEIKRLVEEEYNQDNNIVVPVLENGKFVLKKLNEVSREQLSNFLEQKATYEQATPQKKPVNMVQPQHKPIQQHSDPSGLGMKHSQSSIPLQRAQENKINTSLSADYPEDFESVSIGHSHISREQSSLSKAGRKRQEIVEEEQSISEIYSDNFDSFSQSHISRSNVKKSVEEIAESIRSSMGYSQSYSTRK